MALVTLPSNAMAYGADYTRDYWHAICEPHTQIEDVLKSTFWAHHVTKLKPMALVDIVTLDGFFDITVRIVSVANGIVKANIIRHYEDIEKREPIIEAWLAQQEGGKTTVPGFQRARDVASYVPDGYKVGWNPGSGSFYVQYKITGQQLASGLTDEMAAVRAARAHARAAGFDVPVDEAIDQVPKKPTKAAA